RNAAAELARGAGSRGRSLRDLAGGARGQSRRAGVLRAAGIPRGRCAPEVLRGSGGGRPHGARAAHGLDRTEPLEAVREVSPLDLRQHLLDPPWGNAACAALRTAVLTGRGAAGTRA